MDTTTHDHTDTDTEQDQTPRREERGAPAWGSPRLTAYAVGLLRRPAEAVHPQVLDYLAEIDATLASYGGQFLVHGAAADLREGTYDGDVVLIGFPDLAQARGWYESAAYQAIRPWRSDHISGDVLLIDGVEPDHRATDLVAALSAPAEPR